MQEKIKRLLKISVADNGFYILALHSFIEGYIKEKLHLCEEDFGATMWEYGEYLKSTRNEYIDFSLFNNIREQHILTNGVRHNFCDVDDNEAISMTYLFKKFCSLAKINTVNLSELFKLTDVWQDRKLELKDSGYLNKLQQEIKQLELDNNKMLERLKEFKDIEQSMFEKDNRIQAVDIELNKLKNNLTTKSDRIKKLRKEKNDISMEKKALEKSVESFADVEKYLEYSRRFSLYTRTRSDYERSIIHLTVEQEDILKKVTLTHDFLIKGSAGTGKSLVLLKMLNMVLLKEFSELALEAHKKPIMLTYTNTLVKYNKYLSDILQINNPDNYITTLDSFFYEKMRLCVEHSTINYNILKDLLKNCTIPDYMSIEEVEAEIENFIYANHITREEYIDQMISRKGMKSPLSQKQRERIWDLKNKIEEQMRTTKIYSRNFSHIIIFETLEKRKDDGTNNSLYDVSYILIDEVQDMQAIGLKVLKKLTQHSILMVGDFDQSLYRMASPFARANIKISGYTRILHANFRNTYPIHKLAELFRKKCGKDVIDKELDSYAFREGPMPELYVKKGKNGLSALLIKKIHFYINDLSYEPENICIIVHQKMFIKSLQKKLLAEGFESINISDEGFSFDLTGKIRLTTIHSGKGLDFPVVMLYLPVYSTKSNYDDHITDKLFRNQLYVAFTRAMDSLNVFMYDIDNPILEDLRAVFREM